MNITLAVDVMGGDVGLAVTLPASVQFLIDHPAACLILVGDPHALECALSSVDKAVHSRVRIEPALQVVAMDEAPPSALKNKKDSSMRVAIELVKSAQAQAAVSAGNTGALMAMARFVLKTIPGIDRPAIARMMPTMNGLCCMLDLGANVDCTAEQLLQFGMMGSELFSSLMQKSEPTVGLLNIGTEEIKGNESVKQAFALLKNAGLNFYGNVEGDDIYQGTVDVIVCDGFSGNIALKASEGLAQMITTLMQQEFSRTWSTALIAFIAKPVLRRIGARLDARRYNGASLLGLKGTVVKSHGGADVLAFSYALHQAWEEAHSNVIDHIVKRLDRQLGARQTSTGEDQ